MYSIRGQCSLSRSIGVEYNMKVLMPTYCKTIIFGGYFNLALFVVKTKITKI